jgi:hypothetical protein
LIGFSSSDVLVLESVCGRVRSLHGGGRGSDGLGEQSKGEIYNLFAFTLSIT